MKTPPSNKNVPKRMWEDACEEYESYLRLRKILLDMGLSDNSADEYIDAHAELSQLLDLLDPAEEDFRHDDHAGSFSRAEELLSSMKKTLGY